MNENMKVCKGCGGIMTAKYYNARFHSKKCKDNYWNKVNSRGIKSYRKVKEIDEYDDSCDEHSFN